MATFGLRLKQLREEKGITQIDLAKYLSLANSTISQYEAGKRDPDSSTLQKLSDYFNVTLDYLLGRSDVCNPEIFSDPEVITLARARQKMTPEQLERWKRINREIFPDVFGNDDTEGK